MSRKTSDRNSVSRCVNEWIRSSRSGDGRSIEIEDSSGIAGADQWIKASEILLQSFPTLVRASVRIRYFNEDLLFFSELIPRLQHLKNLYLNGTMVGDTSFIRSSSNFGQLVELGLDDTHVTSKGLLDSVLNLASLKSMTSRTHLTDSELANAVIRLQHLETIILDSTESGDQTFTALTTAMPSIESISMSGTKLTEQGVLNLKMDSKTIKHLDLSGTSVGDQGLLHIAKHCPELNYLFLHGSQITDSGVGGAAPYLMNLKSFAVIRTQVTVEGIRNISSLFPRLSNPLAVSLQIMSK